MNINKKIIQYIDSKELSQREFTKKCGLSEGVLRRGNNIGSGYLKTIKTIYPDLNMNWLLFDEGNMLLEEENVVTVSYEKYHKTCPKCQILEKELKHCNELLEAKKETVEILKSQLDPNRNSKVG
jgi:hypothetical protein